MAKLDLPEKLTVELQKFRDLRYGENPHQKSAFYLTDSLPAGPLRLRSEASRQAKPGFEQLWGIELSHNNLGDANHAWRLVSEFAEPTVAIIKHGNPSGITSRNKLEEAFKLSYDADNVSAFGGIIALNRPPTLAMIDAMHGIFFELLVAPSYSSEVLERLKKRSAKMRVIKAEKPPGQLEFTRVFNGYLVQTPDVIVESKSKWKVESGEVPTSSQFLDMEFAWKVVKHVKSNAIVIVRDKVMVGMGTGQPNRVNSVKLALAQAKGAAYGAVLASDAFFPFADNVLTAAKAGIKVILQPGGSIGDKEVISAANKHKITMVFTGVRHFKH